VKIASLPRPSRQHLAESPLHVIVRDFPETLAEFRAAGAGVGELGHRTPAELDDSAALLDALEVSVSWRPGAERS
jgi:hypothetical protein